MPLLLLSATGAWAITVSTSSVTLAIGAKSTVSVSGTSGKMGVSSTDTAVATAAYSSKTRQVTITARGVGSATINLKDNSGTASIGVTVRAMAVSPNAVSSPIGASTQLVVSYSSGSVRSSSANTAVATVNYANGIATVLSRAKGNTTVTIKDAYTTVQVPVAVKAMSVSPASVNSLAGVVSTLTLSDIGVGRSVIATSADPNVASAAYANGKVTVTANHGGSTSVGITDGYTSLSVPVTVTPMSVSPTSVSVMAGNTATLTVSNAGGTVTATSSNTAVVTASYAGGKVTLTGKSAGTANVTVYDGHTSVVVPVMVASNTGGDVLPGTYTLLAWNDLGMHCMDGDFSVSSILPPFNNLHAQLIDKVSGKLVTASVTVTYESLADADNSINTISSTKTNFWQYAPALFGAGPANDVGLTGYTTPSLTPALMSFESAAGMFVAEGIPITPYDDNGNKNYYPMVKVVARDASGNALAQARVVLPVSDEMSCALCHASQSKAWDGTDSKAKPASGWASATAVTGDARAIERDYKLNILRLHDDKHLRNTSDPDHNNYVSALSAKGFSASGLEASASSGKPVLCAACHSSNALGTTGAANTKSLTSAMHSLHGMVKDAKSGKLLDDITNREACYQCHPGSQTKCLRGVMGTATLTDGTMAMQCQSCHGTMSNVGSATRVGWLDQPNCQACHHDGKREVSAVSSTGILKQWLDTRFATNPNTPANGFSLYRFSKGHGNLQCEACHGSTHAEYPSDHRNDNVLAQDVQGFAGTISECSSCHKNVPLTATGGPHGMHTIGSTWVKGHESAAKNGTTACAYCHGADYRGGPLSTVKKARTFTAEGKTVNFVPGQKVGCYDCHNGPKGD